jgi:hypothetical protein
MPMFKWPRPAAGGPVARRLGALRRQRDEARSSEASSSEAPDACRSCGEPTGAGSVLYSDRVAIVRPDGSRTFLCAECGARVRGAATGRPPTDQDLDTIADNGVMIGTGLLGGK